MSSPPHPVDVDPLHSRPVARLGAVAVLGILVPMTALETYPPTLAPLPTDEELADFVDDFCLEPCDMRAILWMYLDDDGVPLAPPIAVSGCPAVPTRGEAELYATRIVEVAGWVEAASVLLVWQNDDESLSASFDDQRWAQAILSCVDPGGLTIHPPMRRTPTDVSRLVLAG